MEYKTLLRRGPCLVKMRPTFVAVQSLLTSILASPSIKASSSSVPDPCRLDTRSSRSSRAFKPVFTQRAAPLEVDTVDFARPMVLAASMAARCIERRNVVILAGQSAGHN